MITKQDILDRASEWRLTPEVVEKDYVLGWLLAAIGRHVETSDRWVFKGGTCLKKCYVETFRFSEDLDFSLTAEAVYDADGLRWVVAEVAQATAAASGLEFFVDDLVVRERHNRQGQQTWEVRLGYRGPLQFPGQPKVRFDLTRHEAVIRPTEAREVFHEYPDVWSPVATIQCYSFVELLAEKLRALVERTRPRDLYDVVLILDNHAEGILFDELRNVFQRKCAAKNIPMPTAAALVVQVRGAEELVSEWANMLGHQLPELPSLDQLLDRLPTLVGWLDAPPRRAAPRLPSASFGSGPQPPLVAPRSVRYWGLGQPIDLVRFAGANRLMVAFDYHGKSRLVEPYALRTPKTGNLLLYGWEQAAGHIKAFKVAEMQGLRVADQSFSPRYRVEFAA